MVRLLLCTGGALRITSYNVCYTKLLRAALATEAERLRAILATLAKPLDTLDAEVEEELAILALTVARHLVRRELRTDPGQIIAVLRSALAALPGNERDVRVHLHPEDAALVRGSLGDAGGET